MIFLPIVERELRVAARKPSTFWVRFTGVGVALLLACAFLALASVQGVPFAMSGLGRGLFTTLTLLSLASALLAGLFFTSDCLSEEKREGTLGFLFLTDLSGYDVVLGKLLATSLRAVCVMLGMFPILGVTLLMGGVTGAQFWKTCVALLGALFLSLAAGLSVPALSRLSQRAMAATFVVLFLLAAGGPALDGLYAAGRSAPFEPVLSHASPVFLFVVANQWGPPAPFWISLLVNQICVWGLLTLAFVLLPRTWREDGGKRRLRCPALERAWRRVAVRFPGAGRRPLLRTAPLAWLTSRERWQSLVLWGMLAVAAAGFVVGLGHFEVGVWWYGYNYLLSALILVLYLAIASQAGQFFVETRRSGFMELLLVAPVRPEEVVAGHWRGMLRRFALPLILILGLQLAGGLIVQFLTWSQFSSSVASPPAAVSVGTNGATATTNLVVGTSPGMAGGTTFFQEPRLWVLMLTGGASTLMVIANFIALAWFGMWMGMTSRSNHMATLKTILFVQVIPWFVVSLAAGLITAIALVPMMMRQGTGSGFGIMTYQLLTTGASLALTLGKDAAFVIVSRKRLRTRFREWADRSDNRPMAVLPPILKPRSPAAAAGS